MVMVARIFNYHGRILPDPDPKMSPDQVRLFFANAHPELLNATTEGGEFDGTTQTWTFKRAVGTKG
jgi:PRTRC genetic system protein C